MPHHRVRQIARAIRSVARAPESRDETAEVAATLAYWHTRTMAALTAEPVVEAVVAERGEGFLFQPVYTDRHGARKKAFCELRRTRASRHKYSL